VWNDWQTCAQTGFVDFRHVETDRAVGRDPPCVNHGHQTEDRIDATLRKATRGTSLLRRMRVASHSKKKNKKLYDGSASPPIPPRCDPPVLEKTNYQSDFRTAIRRSHRAIVPGRTLRARGKSSFGAEMLTEPEKLSERDCGSKSSRTPPPTLQKSLQPEPQGCVCDQRNSQAGS